MTSGEEVSSRTTSFDLIERFREGDERAFSDLYDRYQPRLGVLIHYRLGDAMRGQYEVDDLLQEVFLTASRDIGRFTYRSPGSFFRWLAHIAGHVIADAARHARRLKRDGGHPIGFRTPSNPAGFEPVDSQTPSRLFRYQEESSRLLARLDSLPQEYREVILLAKFEGLSTTEICERMNKTREQIAMLLHRALKRYRELA
jgi:RNA polymerase sigma-70 factor (subfamily 1)